MIAVAIVTDGTFAAPMRWTARRNPLWSSASDQPLIEIGFLYALHCRTMRDAIEETWGWDET